MSKKYDRYEFTIKFTLLAEYETLLSILTEEKDYTKTARTIIKLHKNFRIFENNIDEFTMFEDFYILSKKYLNRQIDSMKYENEICKIIGISTRLSKIMKNTIKEEIEKL